MLLADKCLGDGEQEDEQPHEGNVGADRGDHVPSGKGVWIVGYTARHASKAKEMHWEEGEIGADKHRPEMEVPEGLGEHVAGHFREPVVPTTKDGEHGSKGQYVVEMSHHVIGVGEGPVDAGIRQHDARNAAN